MVKLIIRGGGGVVFAYSVLMACRLQDGKKKLHATVWRPHSKIPKVSFNASAENHQTLHKETASLLNVRMQWFCPPITNLCSGTQLN